MAEPDLGPGDALEADVLERFCAGDAEALAEVYRRFARPLWGLAMAILRDRQLAEDAVTEAFMRAWRAGPRSTGPVRWDRGCSRSAAAPRDLVPALVPLPPAAHFVVSGGPGAGRTTALKTLVRSLRDATTATVRVLTARPSEWEEPVGGEHLDGAEPTVVVVDGLDAAADVQHILDGLVGGSDVRLLVADRPDAFRLPPPWLRQVLGARCGLLLRPQPDHGDLLRVRLPMRGPVAHPAGRGYLVSDGFAELIQVALPSEAAAAGSGR